MPLQAAGIMPGTNRSGHRLGGAREGRSSCSPRGQARARPEGSSQALSHTPAPSRLWPEPGQLPWESVVKTACRRVSGLSPSPRRSPPRPPPRTLMSTQRPTESGQPLALTPGDPCVFFAPGVPEAWAWGGGCPSPRPHWPTSASPAGLLLAPCSAPFTLKCSRHLPLPAPTIPSFPFHPLL